MINLKSIVNYNTCNLLADCLETLYQFTRNVVFEVIVVDNASTDGSENFIRKRYPEVILINSGENLGFGRANNLGAKWAKGTYLFFLNSDTLLRNNAVRCFFEYAECHRHIRLGAIGGFLLDVEGNVTSSGGNFPTPWSEIAYPLKRLLRIRSKMVLQDKRIDFILGADLFVPRELFVRLGGFDNNIFMYYEETDLQYRMNAAGYERMLIASPKIVHLEGGSFEKRGLSYKRFMMSQRSFNYYIRKHYKGLYYCLFRFVLFLVKVPFVIMSSFVVQEKKEAIKLVVYGRA